MSSQEYIDAVDEYLNKDDWRVYENSNAHYSFGALNKHIVGMVSADYWLDKIYNDDIRESHVEGDFHIHDLGSLTLYCCGYSLRGIIRNGITGISNIPTSKPASHFDSLLAQIANITTIFQNEIAGAVAFSSFDTLVAPFVKEDNLSYDEVCQAMQSFIFQINSNSRMGAEPAFSNLTFDITPPKDLIDKKVWFSGDMLDYTYRECQKEMDMVNRAFYEIMYEGDADDAPFAYPIPTYNIHDRFDWENPNNELLWKMAGKFGIPYFANFLNSDMSPEDSRSMCCRLRLDKRELKKRGGGLFGAAELTGSIGVVTINLPRLGYISNSKEEFYELLDEKMILAKESLEIKRKFIYKQMERGLIPAFKEYVGTLRNHFSTIGLVGMNEMSYNIFDSGIDSKIGHDFSVEVLEYMRERIADFQEETDNLYNLEATPAESTCYRLAMKDKDRFEDSYIKIGVNGEPYYTNSCHLPVDKVKNISQLYENQNDLQKQFNGGTVVHTYLQDSISAEDAKHIVKTVCENYEVPYISLSPLYSICPDHGHLGGFVEVCPECGQAVESYQRITGYIRPVSKFNDGKKAEFFDRNHISV